MGNEYANKLELRLIDFAARIIDVASRFPRTAAGRHFSDQVLRSGSAPALHYGEAQGAESKADFVHKMKVGLKELKETYVTLRIIRPLHWIPDEEMAAMILENNELICIFVSSIKTAIAGKPAF